MEVNPMPPLGSPESISSISNSNNPADVEKKAGTSRINIFSSSSSGRQKVGARIAPILPHLRSVVSPDSSSAEWSTGDEIVSKQIASEEGNALKYRTCSWQKTAMLLFSEYICLAIMSFPWSYSILGLVPGLILTSFIAGVVLYTSLTLWEFCLRHPEVRDICDIGQMLFWGQKWAWYATATMFILNNTFIQGLHVLVTAKWLNTITGHSQCTVVFSVVAAVICFLCSLPRTFSGLSKLALASAVCTFISVILATIFAGIEEHPKGYDLALKGNPIVLAFPQAKTSFVMAMGAFLNISYTFIGQITLPSFIAEMHTPADFPKALWAVTIAEIIVFSVVGAVIYGFTGNQYMSAPAFGSLGNTAFKKISFSFMVPTLVFLGVLYAVVSARFVFFRVFGEGNRHKTGHTVRGWAVWAGILAATWLGAFLIAELIPFFSDLLSLMCSLFDSFFGFIFWGWAWMRMRRIDFRTASEREAEEMNAVEGGAGDAHVAVDDRSWASWWGWAKGLSWRLKAELAANVAICVVGLFFLTAGTYSTVQSIVDSYRANLFGGVFSCADNGL